MQQGLTCRAGSATSTCVGTGAFELSEVCGRGGIRAEVRLTLNGMAGEPFASQGFRTTTLAGQVSRFPLR